MTDKAKLHNLKDDPATRTLPESLDDMNMAQLLSTPEGNALEGADGLSEDELRETIRKARRKPTDETAAARDAAKKA